MQARLSASEEPAAADALVDSLRTLHEDDPAPVYIQIERRIRMGVADGTLQPGDHLPSVRDLARQLGLSPNTVGRAYADLSREGVITARMWRGIFFVGAIMAGGTLAVFDASLPGGLIEGAGDLRYAQTMAFTTLILFQIFNVFNARSDTRSAFHGLFRNHWLWIGLGVSVVLQLAVIYVPFLQKSFSTVSLTSADWLLCAIVASSVLWLRELSKLIMFIRLPSTTA